MYDNDDVLFNKILARGKKRKEKEKEKKKGERKGKKIIHFYLTALFYSPHGVSFYTTWYAKYFHKCERIVT